MRKNKQNETVVYQSKAGAIELSRDIDADTVWATQADIAEIFGSERSVVTKHIRNILKDKELNTRSVCAKMARTAKDGKAYQVQFYSLDVILAVGYRTNSGRAIAFRQWATQTLKSHITNGYTINRHRIKTNYDAFLKAVDDIKSLLPIRGKNHPFVDGNKRSGAYAFIWFLRQAKILDLTKITPPALTAITLLIAESSPKDKEKMVGLVCMLLRSGKN